MKLTKADLKAAYARQDWHTLWLAAMPLGKLTVRRLMEQGRLDPSHASEDLLQDAMVAAGESVRLWIPEQGAFSTWVVSYVRRRVLNSIQAATTGMVGGRKKGVHVVSMHGSPEEENTFQEDEPQEVGIEAALVYDNPPDGFRDPAEEADVLKNGSLTERLLALIPEDDEELVRSLFGVKQTKETQRKYARRNGLTQPEVHRRLETVLESLRSIG